MNREAYGVSEDPGYGYLKEHLIAFTGLAFHANRDEELTQVIGQRLSALGLRGCFSYCRFLDDGDAGRAEMDILIAQLTIGETYFFRDKEQFTAIRNVILPEILERKRSAKRVRIWSAGCATGAEPYSLAILLERERAAWIAGWQIEIHATDLNPGFLAQAAAGKFRELAFRTTPDEVKHDCFSNEGWTWSIHPRYKRWISFHRINLVDRQFGLPFPPRYFDLILCRNVMIYFDTEVNRRLIGQLHQSLEDGGWLVVGASECGPDKFKAFRTVDTGGATVYQKLPRKWMEPMVPAPKLLASNPLASNRVQPSPTPPGLAERGPADMQALRALADRGDWKGAAEYGQRLLIRDKLNPEIHFYHALIAENLGIVNEPEKSLRHAIYLDRSFALAHYHLGVALKRDRRMIKAALAFRNALKVLSGMPDEAIVRAGPGVTVTRLKELAKMHLKNSRAL